MLVRHFAFLFYVLSLFGSQSDATAFVHVDLMQEATVIEASISPLKHDHVSPDGVPQERAVHGALALKRDSAGKYWRIFGGDLRCPKIISAKQFDRDTQFLSHMSSEQSFRPSRLELIEIFLI